MILLMIHCNPIKVISPFFLFFFFSLFFFIFYFLFMNKRLYKTIKPNTKCSPLQAFSKKATKPHKGLKQTKTRNILQKQLSIQATLLPQTKLQTNHQYKLSKKAEKTSQRLITTKIKNKIAGTNKLSTQVALLS
jgi:hypothetical protein